MNMELSAEDKELAALNRQKIYERVQALATAQAIAWWLVLTPDQRESCIEQAVTMRRQEQTS